jgi:hypothetical protein
MRRGAQGALFDFDITKRAVASAFPILPILCLILFEDRILCTQAPISQ